MWMYFCKVTVSKTLLILMCSFKMEQNVCSHNLFAFPVHIKGGQEKELSVVLKSLKTSPGCDSGC